MGLYSHWLGELSLFSIIWQVDRSTVRLVTVLPSVQDMEAFMDISTLSAQQAPPHSGEKGSLGSFMLTLYPLTHSVTPNEISLETLQGVPTSQRLGPLPGAFGSASLHFFEVVFF